MEANDTGFSAPDPHGQPPSLPPPIIAMASGIMAQNAQMFGEAPAPAPASNQAGVNDAPSPAGGVEGVAIASGGAPGHPQQGRRVFTCKKCGRPGHMAKTCKAPLGAVSASAAPARRGGRGGGGVRPGARPPSVPYEEEEEMAIDADADAIAAEVAERNSREELLRVADGCLKSIGT